MKISKPEGGILLNNAGFPREEHEFPGGQMGFQDTDNSLCVSAAMLAMWSPRHPLETCRKTPPS